MKHLVIVESPTKARTITKFLGDDYVIKFSMGHVMDLPKSTLGVDTANKFEPQLEVVSDKKQIIAELKDAAKGAEMIILATDPDREGEAIASNIKDVLEGSQKLKNKNQKFQRIVFHEITKEAVTEALTHPREVDHNLVDAQTARRVLDRLVGYQISPVLWQKVRRGLSAGRVQSVALRVIVEREREIEKFTKEPYFTIHTLLRKEDEKHGIEFELVERDGKRLQVQQTFALYDGDYTVSKTLITEQQEAEKIVSDLESATFTVSDVVQKESRRSPQPPYTTSTLQQDASRRFGYPGKKTMSVAQKLYEEGYITYHRTDSVTLSTASIDAVRSYVKATYGPTYVPAAIRKYIAKQKLAQEAHEGIRPTQVSRLAADVASSMGADCGKLYELIWRRAVASQMSDAVIESTTVMVDANSELQIANSKGVYKLKANGSVLKFEGFLKINPQALSDTRLPSYTAKENLLHQDSRNEMHETPAPPRYNDASLIGTLEEKGIGRPSTYASIISVLTDRAYVERSEKRFIPTAVGMAVNDFLVTNFATIDDIPFTAGMEDNLDLVASGEKEWEVMMQEFYTPFAKSLANVKDAARVKIEAEEVDEKCPDCGANLLIRTGRFGKFFSCSAFPACKFTKPFVEQTNLQCPKDGVLPDRKGGMIIIKKTRKGRKFYGCSNYPNCDFAAWKLEDIKSAESKGQSAMSTEIKAVASS